MTALVFSKWKDQIGEYFKYSFDWDFLDLVAEMVDTYMRSDTREVWTIIDDKLTYSNDRWIVVKHYYSDPADVNWDIAVLNFHDDFRDLISKIEFKMEEQDEEEDA